MPRLNSQVKERIEKLDYAELHEIVVKLASREKFVYDFIVVNYLDKDYGEKELFETAKNDLVIISKKYYKGFSEQLRLANMLGACIKRINEFTRVSKNRVLEAELLLYTLDFPFSLSTNLFGTCFTTYDTKVAIIMKRLINLVNKHLHVDYRIEYQKIINEYLQILHRTSRHIDTVYNMPVAI